MDCFDSNGDRPAPGGCKEPQTFPRAHTLHPSVSAAKESASGRWGVHSMSSLPSHTRQQEMTQNPRALGRVVCLGRAGSGAALCQTLACHSVSPDGWVKPGAPTSR
ncbi:hypothetical protein P7K49_033729 [Saguinus oedipus]|uniref:Uncharacterized protein n=1 Tax=Saguinus oedipus TaxID=9490 RepID=A0ABQ9TSR7_SAGOE|nr:hypothetical protein P7K49_033729 [Saguinus oedipus]